MLELHFKNHLWNVWPRQEFSKFRISFSINFIMYFSYLIYLSLLYFFYKRKLSIYLKNKTCCIKNNIKRNVSTDNINRLKKKQNSHSHLRFGKGVWYRIFIETNKNTKEQRFRTNERTNEQQKKKQKNANIKNNNKE